MSDFEHEFAKYVGRRNAVMVNSGSSADFLLVQALGPAQPGDEILLPAVTWPTQVSACLANGYIVRLIDVDASLQMDVEYLGERLSNHTAAIFPVHVLGNVGDMDAMLDAASEFGSVLLEDCCEALGSRYMGKHVGTFGQAAAFSFFFSHLITTMEGGMVVCDSATSEREYRLRRTHGWHPVEGNYFNFPMWGFNLRPTEVQGAFGVEQLRKIEDFVRAREINGENIYADTAYRYQDFFDWIPVSRDCQPVWHGAAFMISKDAPFTKAQLCRYLTEHEVENRPIIAGNLARQPAAIDDPRIVYDDLPGADAVHERGFYIGLPNHEDGEATAYVAQVFEDFVKTLYP